MSMNTRAFEQVGWARISYAVHDVENVQRRLQSIGYSIRDFEIGPLVDEFRIYSQLEEYAGEYRRYGGSDECSFLEKALEHFLSFKLANPQPGQTFMDVGSCVSVVPGVLRRVYRCKCYAQDLELPPGIRAWKIGSNAASIPLQDQTLDGMTLHCTFEHFEGDADTAFVRECARLLKPGGKVVILPTYVANEWSNVTGEISETKRSTIQFDPEAKYWSVIPEWKNRFGRHYSPEALHGRVLTPALRAGLIPQLYRVREHEKVHPDLWLRWILLLSK
jgi:SAM-dependent methyltransferase